MGTSNNNLQAKTIFKAFSFQGIPATAGLSILIFFEARLTSAYSKGRFKSTSSLESVSRMSLALDGVGTIREEGGETE